MHKKILRLAIPNIISNLSVPLLSSVDTIVVGHLEKVSYLAAIALGTMIFHFIYMGLGFLRMGTTGLTAQAFGSKNEEEISSVLGRAVLVALGCAAVLLIAQSLISNISFYLVDASSEVETLAAEYFDIRIWAAPATLSLYAFHGWFLGMQNAKYPLILAVFINLVNIGLNLLLIYQFGMKADGVALGTVISQYLGLGLAVILFLKKYGSYKPTIFLKKILDPAPLKKFFEINSDILIRTVALIFAFAYFTAKSAEFGDDILAANSILINLWMIIAFGVDGFAFAAESLVGKYIGARDLTKLKQVVHFSFYWGVGLGVLNSAVYYAGGEFILALFTDKINLIKIAMDYYLWTVFAPIVNSFCFIWDGIFIGATATRPMRNTMLFTIFFIFLPVYFVSINYLGNHSLWLAMTAFMISRGITLTVYAPKNIYQKVMN